MKRKLTLPIRVVLTCCGIAGVCVLVAADLLAQCGAGYIGMELVLSQDSVDVVFSGTVASVERAGLTETVIFDVDRVWKGSSGTLMTIHRRIPVRTGTAEFAPTTFERGNRYIVIAHHLSAAEENDLGLSPPGEYFGTDMCGGGSRPFSFGEEDLRTIGPGRPPGAVRNPPPGPIRKTHDAHPVWPDAAQRANVRGTVLVEFTIAPDGRVTDARILRGIPLLDEAALDCVRQWRYEPVLLNGRPFPMHITAAVSFP